MGVCVRGVGFGWLCCAACASSNSPLAALRAFCFVLFFFLLLLYGLFFSRRAVAWRGEIFSAVGCNVL
jgi:hypothetical protein